MGLRRVVTVLGHGEDEDNGSNKLEREACLKRLVSLVQPTTPCSLQQCNSYQPEETPAEEKDDKIFSSLLSLPNLHCSDRHIDPPDPLVSI